MAGKTFKEQSQVLWINTCINFIRGHGKISRTTLCNELGISITSVNSIISWLKEQHLIRECSAEDSTGGRKPSLISLVPDGAFFAGLEFSADGISCVVLDMTRTVVYKRFRQFTDAESSSDLIAAIERELNAVIAFLGEQEKRLVGIAVGAPGYLDYESGMLLFYSQREEWNNTPLMARLREQFHYPIFLLNNVDVMPYAYKWVSCNGSCEDHVMLVVRYGLKMSAFASNRQIKGAHNFMGEIGHMHVNGSNRLCRCGKHGCFDTEVTYPALKQKIEDGISVGHFKYMAKLMEEAGGFTIDLFTQACNSGDRDSLLLMEETVRNICSAISWICYMIDPAVIMISSKLDQFNGFYDMMSDTLYRIYENNFTYGKLNIQPAPFGEYLGAVGAAAYVYDKAYGRIIEPEA